MQNKPACRPGRRAVVLLSGGLDSAVVLYLAKKQGFACFCLIFDYGQRHIREIESAKKVAQAAGCSYKILKIKLPWKGSSLLEKKAKLKPANRQTGRPEGRGWASFGPSRKPANIPLTYVPARNIIFLSFALSYAEAIKAGAIFIGAHAQDYSGYPDCRPEFYQAFRRVVSCGTKAGSEKKQIKIEVPLINKTKAQIIRIGERLAVPFELTWSCYLGGKAPCGKCESCYFRAKGFREAGV